MLICCLTILVALLQRLELCQLLVQDDRACLLLYKLLTPLSILHFLLLIQQTCLFELRAPSIQFSRCIGEALDFDLLLLHLFFIISLCFEQVVGCYFVVLDLEQGIEGLFALAGCFQENRGKGALWHAQCIAKQRVERSFAINAEEIIQFVQHIGALFKAYIGLFVINQPARDRPAAPLDRIRPCIATDEVKDHLTILFAFAYKVILSIRKVTKEGKAHSLNQRCLARAILSANRRCAALKIHDELTITLNILQFNTSNEHMTIANLPSKRKNVDSRNYSASKQRRRSDIPL